MAKRITKKTEVSFEGEELQAALRLALAPLSLDEFSSEYINFINTLPGAENINLPARYLQNIRGFDFYNVLKYGEFTKDDIVLDTGAFHTFFCIYLSRFVAKVHATDSFYWAGRSYAKELQTMHEWIDSVTLASKNIRAYPMDLRYIGFDDNTFDKVVCISTIEHIDTDYQALQEMMRVLKPGGKLLLTTEYHETNNKSYSEGDETFYRVYNKVELDNLAGGLNVGARIINTDLTHPEGFNVIFLEITK